MKRTISILLFLLGSALFSQELEPAYWYLMEPQRQTYDLGFSLSNSGEEELQILLMPQSEYISVQENRITLNPGESRSIIMEVNLAEASIPFQESLLIMANGKRTMLPIYAGVEPPLEEDQPALVEGELILDYFYSPECLSCLELILESLEALNPELRERIALNRWNILDDRGMDRLLEFYPEGFPEELPVLIVDGQIAQGEERIKGLLSSSLEELKGQYDLGPARSNGLSNLWYSQVFRDLILLLSFLMIIAGLGVTWFFHRKRKKNSQDRD